MVRPKGKISAKPGDPAWTDLVTEIEGIVSHRFVENPDPHPFGDPSYIPNEGEEPGFSFASLNREDRQDLLAEMVDWRHYGNRGISHDQQRIVIGNVLDEKPQEKWLEGVFDEAVLEKDRIMSFKMMVDNMKHSPGGHHFEEMNGDWRPWDDLTAAAKLQYIVRDAVISDVPFESFAKEVKNTIGDRLDAALRVVFEGQQELHAIAGLFPDDGRTETTPLVEQVKDLLEHAVASEFQEATGKYASRGGLDEMRVNLKISLADLKAEGRRQQQGPQKTKDIGLER